MTTIFQATCACGYDIAQGRVIHCPRHKAAPAMLEALQAALPRLAHKFECGGVNPSEEWVEKGSQNADNCKCAISIVEAAIALAEGGDNG